MSRNPWYDRGSKFSHGTAQKWRTGCRCSDCCEANKFYGRIKSRQARLRKAQLKHPERYDMSHDDKIDTLLEILHG